MKALLLILIGIFGLLGILFYETLKRIFIPRIIGWIANQESLPFFPNGLAMFPKESRSIRISKNNSFETFFLTKDGSGYLYQFLPNKPDWPTESAKWFIIPNPGTDEKIEEICEYLENKGKYSVKLSDKEREQLKMHSGLTVPETMTDWQKLCWKYKIFWYQDWSGQKRVENKKISYSTKGSTDTLISHLNENSPYYFANYFEYGFVVDNQEDIDTLKLKVTFTVSGANDNPHISDIEHANVFTKIASLVEAKAADVISESSFHRLSKKAQEFIQKIGNENPEVVALEEDKVQNIRAIFQEKIIEELEKNELGFVWDPNSVNVLQVEPVGKDSIELLEKILKARAVEYENFVDLKQNEADNKIKLNDAETLKSTTILKAQGDAEKKRIETKAAKNALETLTPVEANQLKVKLQAVKDAGGDPDLILKGLIIEKLKIPEGSLSLVNLGEIISSLTKK
jgi:hypothetical protein